MDQKVINEIKKLNQLICKNITVWEHKSHLNPTQMQIVMYLIKHIDEEACQKDLEIETNLKKASITGTLDSMEEKGVIIRKQSESDKRKNIITLSERVIKEKNKVEERASQIEKRLQENITDKEMQDFLVVVKKMTANMENK